MLHKEAWVGTLLGTILRIKDHKKVKISDPWQLKQGSYKGPVMINNILIYFLFWTHPYTCIYITFRTYYIINSHTRRSDPRNFFSFSWTFRHSLSEVQKYVDYTITAPFLKVFLCYLVNRNILILHSSS